MLKQGIEAGVLRYHVKMSIWRRGCESADGVSDVEVDGIFSAAIDLDVFDIRSERLEGARHCYRDFALMSTQENLDLVRTAVQ